ncbi:hypothetical protein FWG95_00120 [Candidatus Saccharibacteria bacterium]|nr:hypothetical protein [Candidatus Saccharibacteria bacterium]
MTQILNKKTTVNYDKERLGQAVQKAARSNCILAGDAENLAQRVVAKIDRWLTDKPEVTARELRLQTAAAMGDYDLEAAYLYENEKRLF